MRKFPWKSLSTIFIAWFPSFAIISVGVYHHPKGTNIPFYGGNALPGKRLKFLFVHLPRVESAEIEDGLVSILAKSKNRIWQRYPRMISEFYLQIKSLKKSTF